MLPWNFVMTYDALCGVVALSTSQMQMRRCKGALEDATVQGNTLVFLPFLSLGFLCGLVSSRGSFSASKFIGYAAESA